MEGLESRNGTSAAYGHACTNCSRAKSRCTVREEGRACQRCHRLGKECISSSSTRKRNTRKTPTETRRHQLEEKLDGLVSLLQAQNPTNPSGQDNAAPTPPISYRSAQDYVPREQELFNREEDGLWNNLTKQDLDTFRTRYLPHLPFTYLPAHSTTYQLQSEYPLLCLVIRTICEKRLPRQLEMGAGFRRVLARKTVISDERSMDLLLSIIAVSTWPLAFGHGKDFMTMLVNLGKIMVADLRLDRPPVQLVRCPRIGPDIFEHKGVRTNNGRRALLAFFSIGASVMNCMGYEVLQWSPQLDEACKTLSDDNESPDDKPLVAMALIARVAFDAAKTVRRASEELDFANNVIHQIRALHISLGQTKIQMSAEQLANESVLSFLYNAEISVYEAILHQPTSPVIHEPLNLRRVEYLSACLQACRTCMEHYLAINPARQTTPIMLTLPYTLVVLYRLSVISDPLWDRNFVRTTADIVTYLERAVLNMEQANSVLRAETGEDSMFVKGVETLRGSIPKFRSALERHGGGDSLNERASTEEAVTGDGFDFAMMDFMDDMWYSDIFGAATA